MYPGQYPQPNPRRAQFECPMISGYSTARLYAPVLATARDPSDNLLGVSATVTNQTTTTVVMSFVPLESSSQPVLSGSGDRCALFNATGTAIGNYIYLSGGGEVRVNFKTSRSFLELFADNGGPAQVRVQLDSLIQWDSVGFGRLETKYPPQLYQPKWSSFPWPTG